MRITLDLYTDDMILAEIALAYVLACKLFDNGEDVLDEKRKLSEAGIANAGESEFWAEVKRITDGVAK